MCVKLIANPTAGDGDTSDAADNRLQVIGYLEKNGLKVDVALIKPKEEATPVARRASKKEYKVVIAMGGDGTIEAVMRGMVGSKARLGIIPAGSRNECRRPLEASLQALHQPRSFHDTEAQGRKEKFGLQQGSKHKSIPGNDFTLIIA